MASSPGMSFPPGRDSNQSPPYFIKPPSPFPLIAIDSILTFPILLTNSIFTNNIPSLASLSSLCVSFYQMQDPKSTYFNMSVPLSNAPAATDVIGHINPHFELPEPRVGDNQPATCARQDPLLRVGTPARDAFDKNNQMTVEVRFKIYTDKEVEINAPTTSTPKVGAGKKTAKADKLNLIDSKAINTGYLEIKSCLFGKSLKDFKALVAGACEEYEGGMKNIILISDFAPDLKWKTTVGRFKVVLDSAIQWQNFVDALDKSVKKKGILLIENDNVQVKAKVVNKEHESEESKNKRELKTLANQIFSQHAIGTYAGGPGTVLTTPWDPNCRYRLTYPAAWIWAKGVAAKIATTWIPPNTAEFRYEIKKSEWIHPDMGVEDRVQLRLQGHPRRLEAINTPSNSVHPPHSSGSSSIKRTLSQKHKLSNSSVGGDVKPDLSKLGERRDVSSSNEVFDVKPDLKKIKVEDQEITNSFNNPIYVSSDSESRWESDFSSGADEIDVENPSTAHSVQMELFLADCNIDFQDEQTRKLLREAGILSWTDLIPSLQLTEATLTSKGIDRQIAHRLMTAAQARFENGHE
ncbi:uncharacterized protein MELLADRAFT_92144 [Melampsora larici-populina 98AG31]|uniref:Uncharacterized protein n=1 Tax=Melampsora larici-populina (strain 98AG31 / pathotype 3-4-7) TaxID=747676 RepID=F4S1N7_MELLP|nr:uncharacterized protein MELLADRAFT_92144 [Melampsora larici-populina 98AG31]EGG01476.1 hypothetical protein MELLADRAFT_92144 [Melampsora larici-populina 98AG31]